MATTKTIRTALALLSSARYDYAPSAESEMNATRTAWEVAFGNVADEGLIDATRAYLQSAATKWPSPGALLAMLPNPRLDADRQAWAQLADGGGTVGFSPAHRAAATKANVPSGFTMRRLTTTEAGFIERRFLAACAEPESLALAAAPPLRPAIAERTEPRIATDTAAPPQVFRRPVAEPTPAAPPRRNPDEVSVEECLQKRPTIGVYRDSPVWPSILRTTQVLVAGGRL